MGNLSNLYISQSYQSLIHLGSDNTASTTLVGLQDGLGNSIGVSVNTGGDLSISGSFTSSLQQGYVWVGDASGKTSTVPTSSFGGGGGTINTGSFATTGSNTFNGNQTINGYINVGGGIGVSGSQTIGTSTGSINLNVGTGSINLTVGRSSQSIIFLNSYLTQNVGRFSVAGDEFNVKTQDDTSLKLSLDTTQGEYVPMNLYGQYAYQSVNVHSGNSGSAPYAGHTIDDADTSGNNIGMFGTYIDGATQGTYGAIFVGGGQTNNAASDGIMFRSYGNYNSVDFLKNVAITGSLSVRNALTASGLRYPTTDGTYSGQTLQTNAAGVLSFADVQTTFDTVYNGEATTLTKGTPVYVSGSQGANPKVYRADASSTTKMPVLYVISENIATASTGRGIILGHIEGIDLTGYTDGQAIYVAEGGGWSSSRPSGSASTVQLLGVITKSGSGGKGLVLNPGPATLPNLQNGYVWVGNATNQPTAILTSSLQTNVSGLVTTSSFNTYTSSNDTKWTTLGSYTSSVDTKFATIGTQSGSWGGGGSAFPYTGSAVITGSLTITGSVSAKVNALVVSATTASLDFSLGNFFTLNLPTGSTTFINPINIKAGQTINLQVSQSSASTGSIAFANSVKFAGGYDYTATAITGALDIVSFVAFDTNQVLATSVKNLS